jgi:hypothetical protein
VIVRLTAAVALVVTIVALAAPTARAEEPRPRGSVLDWDSGTGKSYVIPAAEVVGFIAALNAFNRLVIDSDEYGSDGHSIGKNLQTAPQFDTDPFSVNQLGHPYQGSIYYGLARSAGLNYWESLGYTLAGSFLWETAGETPGFWRELGAAVISPGLGLNRLLFGDRFKPVFPSRDPAVYVRLRVGATLTTSVNNAGLSSDVREQDGSMDFYVTYGLPGKPGYRYTRPFDFFLFEFTAVPNADSAPDAVENLTIRGLLVGAPYAAGDDYRGIWGLFGGYEYLSPQVFRVATTNLALGTIGQWWLTRTVALQASALAGVGFGAAGTVGDRAERDYHYGVIPEGLLGLRLIFADLAMLEAQGRQYHVLGTAAEAAPNTSTFGRELVHRANVGLTVRVYGPHALSLNYVVSSRDATAISGAERHQSVETLTLAYNFLGHTRFGFVEWRPSELAAR